MEFLIKHIKKFQNKYLSTKVVFALDMIVSFLASVITLIFVQVILLRNESHLGISSLWLLSSLVFSFIYIWIFKTYRIIIRYTTFREQGRFFLVALCKVLSIGVVYIMFRVPSTVLYVLLISDLIFTFLGFFLLRAMMIMAYESIKARLSVKNLCTNVLVYGVGSKSVSLLSRLQNSSEYKIVGFIQYGTTQIKHIIAEKTVYYASNEEQLRYVINRTDARAVLFATEKDAKQEVDRIIKYANENKIKSLIAPRIDEVVDGKLPYKLRNIDIEDLLMRPEINISMDAIMDNFRDKTVLVTGAAGSIGSELCRQLATFGIKELILYDNAETPMHNLRLELEESYSNLLFVPIIGDVRMVNRLDYVFKKFKPQVVFHAAAYKHVPLMEENPCEAVLVNVVGTRNVADKCLEYGVEKMVMVSTDKAVNPTNIMGCTKRLAEIYVQSLGLSVEKGVQKGITQFVTTRFGNVLGSSGSVIPRFREQISKGGPVTVTHPEITRYFMTIPEACRLVMEAATMTTGNQIFVFDMGESVKIDDLARRMIQLAGYTPNVEIQIEYSGLRPGEKLYEEVLSDRENTLPTDHSRIRIAKVRDYEYSVATSSIQQLQEYAHKVDIPCLVKLMKEIVPEFISNNSKFEEFD